MYRAWINPDSTDRHVAVLDNEPFDLEAMTLSDLREKIIDSFFDWRSNKWGCPQVLAVLGTEESCGIVSFNRVLRDAWMESVNDDHR